MSDIEPHELSAYLDGELDAERTRFVTDRLGSDPALREQFEALAAADTAWRRTAQSAVFTPSVRWPKERAGGISALAAVSLTIALIALKLVTSFTGGVALALVAHAAALVIALGGVTWLAASQARDVTALPR